jgi:peptidoglycan-N-acetylglucosamine deacetylase
MQLERICLITNDVETTSLWNHCLSDKTGEKVLKIGMPKLLDLYEQCNVKSTFFFTGYIAEKFPDIVKMILPYGHEVACHAHSHHHERAFDKMSFEEQYRDLIRSKKILEDISGEEVISFRSPALRVNEFTPKALQKAGFKIDSSISSQRGDMIFSLGSRRKYKWLTAPRKPYFTSENELSIKGSSEVLEIPISAIILPFISTVMRISPNTFALLRHLLSLENKFTNKPLVFLIHPNELIEEKIEKSMISRRSKNLLSFMIKDRIKYRLKLKNLGDKTLDIYKKEIIALQKEGYKFINMRDYYNQVKRNKE